MSSPSTIYNLQSTIGITIRPAHPNEAAAISVLVMRSKAHWGYDAEFLASCRPGLTVSPAYLVTHPAYVAAQDGSIVGFYSLDEDMVGQQVALDFLFIAPEAIGRGVGQLVWQHAVEEARRRGYHWMSIVADPNAEGFYRKMGAVTVGSEPSEAQVGRMLPLMRYSLELGG